MSFLSRFCSGLIVIGLATLAGSAHATPFETQVGTACANAAHSTDFDTLVQCSSTSSTAGTFQKAPLFIGAVTSPPYTSTTCDANKAGMIQYTGGTMQYCNSSAWMTFGSSTLGTSASATNPYVTGAVNTGLFSATATTVSIATDGTERLRVGATGAVTIGATAATSGTILDLAAGTGTAYSSVMLPKDTTANRPTTGVEGMMRYNTTTRAFEGYQGATPTWSQMAKAAESLTTSTATASWTLNPGSYGSVTGGVSDIIDTSTGTTMVLRTDVSTIDWLGGTSATTFAGPTSSSCAVYKLDFGAGARGRAYVSVTVDPEQTSGSICSGWGVGTVFAIYSTDTSYTSGCTFANGSQVVNFAVLYNGCGDPAAVTSTGGGFFLGRYLYLIAAGTRNSWAGDYMNGRGKATINLLDVRLE